MTNQAITPVETVAPRGFWSSLSHAIARPFSAVGNAGEAAEAALGDVTFYVTENSKANRITITNNAQMRAAKAMTEHKAVLEADPELQATLNEIATNW